MVGLIQLPVVVGLFLVAFAGAAIGVAFTFALAKFWRPEPTESLADITTFSMRAIGALYALVLALAFNSVIGEHNQLEEAIEEEAVLLVQIAEDSIEEMDERTGRAMAEDIAVYVGAVVNEEWNAQSADLVPRTAEAALERMRKRLPLLEAEDPAMVAEIDLMLDEVERRRLQRLLDLEQSLPPLFWILSVVLFFALLVPVARFVPTRANAVLVGTYSAAVGALLYSILMMSEPFRSSMPVSNEPFLLVMSYLERTVGP